MAIAKISQNSNQYLVNEGEDLFADYLLSVGDGIYGENIKLPSTIKGEGDVVEFVYVHIQNSIAEGLLTELAIIAPTNEDCAQLNQQVLDFLDGEERVYLNIDKVVSDDINEHLLLPTEFLNKVEGGHLFQKGMNVMLSIFAMQRCEEYFPEPLKFIPERFEDAQFTNPYIYTPFSAGPRNCIGQKFAMLEVKSTLSKILRNFELKPATPVHELQLVPETILVSKNGVRISLKDRNE
ncbi:unnamed protein product [Diabrotica balteata]|uniref:Cytochrome P450 n=1 Tax=Diabrotica balteata TaxID=107213 RepID=A0A9N9SQ73_DIABA|nr:unnamed protein product [Diabrotica balteata]